MDQIKTKRDQAVRDVKAESILNASRIVFADKGFHDARLEDIAAEAGFSKASLYNYFSDKEQIFLTLVVRDFEELLTKLDQNLNNASGSFLVSIEFMFRTVLTFFGQHFAFFWAVTNFKTVCSFGVERLERHHAELIARFEQQYAGLLESFTNVLREAKKNHEFQSPIDEMTLSHYIAALVRGIVFEWKSCGKMGDVDATVKDLMEFTLHGLWSNKNV